MTRADALRMLFLAPLGALFGAVFRRKPEPYPVAWHAEHVAVVVDEASEIEASTFFLAQDGPYVFRDDGDFTRLGATRPRYLYLSDRTILNDGVVIFR